MLERLEDLGAHSGLRAASGATSPIRVLHCLWNGEVGGAERAVHLLVREQLKDADLAPALLFAQGRGPYWRESQRLGCPVISLDLSSGHDVRRLGGIAAAMSPFDLHHFHSAEPLLMLASTRCRRVRRVYTHRGGIIRYRALKRLTYASAGWLIRHQFHGFSGNTRHAARFAADLYHLDSGRLDVTYNGLDFSLLEPTRQADAIRAELGLQPTDFVLGTAAQLRPLKRVDTLILAAKNLAGGRFRALIVGDGPDRPRLQALVDDLGAESSVVFAGSQRHIGDYLQVMDAFCLPSTTSESFGNAAVEAMAMGVPSIIFQDGGGLLEHIDDGVTGLVVKDQTDLERSLRELMGDPGLARRLGASGSDYVRQRYTLEQAARHYRRLYATALNA